jgi:hypothetical protein
MSTSSYKKPGLVLKRSSSSASKIQIKDLQRDLRQLGYLYRWIDGGFGLGTERAVKALQYDLLNNMGQSTRMDGEAPVAIADYNRGRVTDVNGIVDQNLAQCISDMLDDTEYPKLPFAENPQEANREVIQQLNSLRSSQVPIPFLKAIFKQESNLKHFYVPSGADEDSYIVVGMDINAGEKHIITSRGYGLGQFTLFHHPPAKKEIENFMVDIQGNISKAITELKDKFENFVTGPPGGRRADDRFADGRTQQKPLICKYDENDSRFLTDCKSCAQSVNKQQIVADKTSFYKGSKNKFQKTKYHEGSYENVPVRKDFPCDWPYAMRRYNGSGVNSYNYQARVLKRLAKL